MIGGVVFTGRDRKQRLLDAAESEQQEQRKMALVSERFGLARLLPTARRFPRTRSAEPNVLAAHDLARSDDEAIRILQAALKEQRLTQGDPVRRELGFAELVLHYVSPDDVRPPIKTLQLTSDEWLTAEPTTTTRSGSIRIDSDGPATEIRFFPLPWQ